MKLTHMEPRDRGMPKNQYGSSSYGDWCKREAKRIGGDARYVEEYRIKVGKETKIVDSKTKGAIAWCRVDRIDQD